MHYFIIIPIIIVVVYYQIKSFISSLEKLEIFKTIFASENDAYDYDIDSKKVQIEGEQNPVLVKIVESINNYISNNKGTVSDFNLMKDIVERNCDAKDEEISAQIPVPLYWGLSGTMIGILVGIVFLLFSGSLKDLLGSGTDNGIEGMETLLSGVALAMISSILGILLTTTGSNKFKDGKVELENNKNIFLSWIQAKLLPTLSDTVSDTLERMSRNLSEFNSTFLTNISKLDQTFDTVSELVRELKNLNITKISTENIRVYKSLKNCTNEIGQFAVYLYSVNEYLANIRALNSKLDEYERRTQVIEKAGEFYEKNEKWLSETIDGANFETSNALNRFKQTITESLKSLQDSLYGQLFDINTIMNRHQEMLSQKSQETFEVIMDSLKEFISGQILRFDEVMKGQQEMLQNKSQEISDIVTELKNLVAIKTSMSELEKATAEQNKKIDRLADEIKALVQSQRPVENPVVQVQIISKRLKIAIMASIGVLSVSFLVFVVLFVVKYIM